MERVWTPAPDDPRPGGPQGRLRAARRALSDALGALLASK
jgi:hypothetical protein